MSWDRVIKSSQSVKGTSVLSTMESRDFLQKVKRLGELDDTSQILHKDAKMLSDRESEVFKAEKKLVSDLAQSAPVRDDPDLRVVMQEWTEYISHAEVYLNSLTSDTNKVMLEPVKRLITVFPNIQISIRKRENLLAEYEKWQQKVDKLKKKERSGANIVKLDAHQKSLDVAREEFEAESKELLSYMSSLYEQRKEYLTPSIQALINMQICHIGEGFKGYTELQARFEPPGQPSDVVDKFSEFKTLSIVSTDTL